MEFDEGMKIVWHNSYEGGVDTPCLEYYNMDCPHCAVTKEDGMRTREYYAWTVYDYDKQKQRILMYAVSDAYTPIMAILAIYDEFGTVLDRDLIIKRTGKKLNTNYTVINGDKSRSPRGKVWTQEQIFAKIKKAYIDIEEEEPEPEQRTRTRSRKSQTQQQTVEEIIEMQPLGILRKMMEALGEEYTRADSIDNLIDTIMLYAEKDIRDVIEEVTENEDIPF